MICSATAVMSGPMTSGMGTAGRSSGALPLRATNAARQGSVAGVVETGGGVVSGS